MTNTVMRTDGPKTIERVLAQTADTLTPGHWKSDTRLAIPNPPLENLRDVSKHPKDLTLMQT